jgi:hypothetical protein
MKSPSLLMIKISIRIILNIIVLVFIYLETGPATTIFASLVSISIEMDAILTRRQMIRLEKIEANIIKLIKVVIHNMQGKNES